VTLRNAVTIIALATLLAGCAGAPIIKIDQPGLMSGKENAQPPTLPEARMQLLAVRSKYREAIADQLRVTQFSGAGLVVLGAAVTGLAAGGVHRDAILGASLLGGTAYAVGNLTLDRRRVLAFDAGIRALDCAHAAVIPLDLGAERLGALQKANASLKRTRSELETSSLALRKLAGPLQSESLLDPTSSADLRALLAQIDAALESSEKTRKAAARLTEDTREIAARLQNTVNTIAARVDGFIAQTVPDLTAVPQAIAGLGGFAAAFAPGAGIDKTLAESMNKAANKVMAKTARGGEAGKRVEQLETAMTKASTLVDNLSVASDAVIELLGAVDGTAVVGALKACNVADVALPLSLEPTVLLVDARGGPGKGFAIRGGTKPYMVRWLDAAADGLSLTFAGGFSDLAQVSAGKEVPGGGYRLQVSDAAGGSIQLVVTVNGTQPSPAAGQDTTGSKGPSETESLVRDFNALGSFSFPVGETKITIPKDGFSLGKESKTVLVEFTCEPAPSPSNRLSSNDVVKSLYEEVKKRTKSDPRTDTKLIELKPKTPNCLKD
jgi:hypothetical protein